jgi:hypothetical protein
VQALRSAIDLTYEFDYEPSPEEINGRGFIVHKFKQVAALDEVI